MSLESCSHPHSHTCSKCGKSSVISRRRVHTLLLHVGHLGAVFTLGSAAAAPLPCCSSHAAHIVLTVTVYTVYTACAASCGPLGTRRRAWSTTRNSNIGTEESWRGGRWPRRGEGGCALEDKMPMRRHSDGTLMGSRVHCMQTAKKTVCTVAPHWTATGLPLDCNCI